MFDTVKTLWKGFSGALKFHKEGRKLIWLLLLTFIAGWFATGFAGWVSFPSYRALIIYLPGADQIALGFTGGIAGFLYFTLAYLSGYFVEMWKRIPAEDRNYSLLGARILGVSAILFLAADFYMNMQGKDYRAEEAAGAVVSFTYETPEADRVALVEAQKRLAEVESGQVGGYGWRDPKTQIWHLNGSGKNATSELRATIRRIQQADSTSKAAFLADQSAANAARQMRESKTKETLKNAVYGVYGIVLILCIVQAYIVETIQLAEARESEEEQEEDPEPVTGRRETVDKNLYSKQEIGFATASKKSTDPKANFSGKSEDKHTVKYVDTKYSDFGHRNNTGMKYATGKKQQVLKAYRKLSKEGEVPTISALATTAGVDWRTAKKAVEEFNLPTK